MAEEEKVTICRCEDVTLDEILEAIRTHRVRSLEELKRILRIGMGACQGRTCLRLAASVLAREIGVSTVEVMKTLPRPRPPVVPVPVGTLSGVELGEGSED